MEQETLESPAAVKHESQLVTFLLEEEEFGFDIMSVQEIIRLPKMAKVPRTPAYVDGIANLRGVVLPVIDMRTRFGMERTGETDRTRVLVVDIDGVKTGLRVDRVNQVTRILGSEVEPPPSAIRGTSSDYLEGVVKLDQGKRIIMALNAAQVCQIAVSHKADSVNKMASPDFGSEPGAIPSLQRHVAEVQKMVTFRIAKEEFAFHMEHVREILRVQTPNQVPDVPDYVLGMLTVRGQILPVIDLRRLLQQQSFAEEFAESCRPLREEYERWIDETEKAFLNGSYAKMDASIAERLRKWIAETNSSSQLLMEELAKARVLNEKVINQLQSHARYAERGDRDGARSCGDEAISGGRATAVALQSFEQQIAKNIQEDQRIIVVDSEGLVLGLVVDHVHEVLNVPTNLIEPPPSITGDGGMELSGVAKLDDGARLIMVLDVATLMKDQKLQDIGDVSHHSGEEQDVDTQKTATEAQELSEIQLVTFLLGDEEFGVPISQIQEIDRLGKITKVPNAATFIEGVTNLRGEVIPVMDTRKRFDLEVRPSDDRTRIIIVNLGGIRTGLVVDSVRQVLNLAKKDIAPTPEGLGSGIDQQFISGIGQVDGGKRMIVLLDMEKILTRHEQEHLSKVSQA